MSSLTHSLATPAQLAWYYYRGTGSGKAHNLLAHPYARSNTPKRAPRQAVSVAVTGMKSETGMPKKK